MKILGVNVGSSSLKCQLFDMPDETVLARARVERIGSESARIEWVDTTGKSEAVEMPIPDRLAAIQLVVARIDLSGVDALAFKPVYARGITGCVRMNDAALAAMDEYSDIMAPLHNPMYIEAIRSFRLVLPDIPVLGLFENSFFDKMPDHAAIYPIPWDWTSRYAIRRQGWHGASHYYVSRRVAALMGRDVKEIRIITCHLGGSSSIAAVESGVAVDTSFGFTTQSGLPQSERSSDMDAFLIPFLVSRGEGSMEEIVDRLTFQGGLSAVSGMGFDMRDLEKAAREGHERASLALDMYIYAVRKSLGSFVFALGGVDAIAFAGGTGEGSAYVRKGVLQGLEALGIVLDVSRNESCIGEEHRISGCASNIEVWVIPTKEELVVVRECYRQLASGGAASISKGA